MGTYHAKRGDNRLVGDCILTAISDFAEDLLRASEIEYINLQEMKEGTILPIIFFAVNQSIDKALMVMRDRIPEMVPPMREYKKRVEEKKE